MKAVGIAALAALVGTVASQREERGFAILTFTNNGLVETREDPIVSPGKEASHVHIVFGGNRFSMNATGESMKESDCTTSRAAQDKSAYWYPKLYFQDPDTKKLEGVEASYAKIYYFFDKTKDKIKAFPTGLQIVGGDPWTRTAPKVHKLVENYSQDNDVIQNIKWSCPRSGEGMTSWHTDSDGSDCGLATNEQGTEGLGFPDYHCDGLYSPLRADIHMPSCYNPEKALDDHKNNMDFPTDEGGYLNCPPGWIHVPHLFYELYWNTKPFQNRWTQGQRKQPFVLSTGDVTGFSSHADFLAAWDEDALQNVIDNCNNKHDGLHLCPGITEVTKADCTIDSNIDEDVHGPFSELPGKNPLLGWSFGTDGLEDLLPDNSNSDKSGSDKSPGLPDAEKPATNVVENAQQEESAKPEPAPVAEYQELEPAPEESTSCEKKLHTAWETVYVTEEVPAAPTHAARHLHGHQHAKRHNH